MQPPFGADAFFGVFVSYNEAIGPAPIVAWMLGLAAVALVLRPAAWSGRVVTAILAGFWMWMGLAYHIGAFAAVNPPAYAFGALFLVQAVLLVGYGVVGGRLDYRPRRGLVDIAAAGLIVYALSVYAILGAVFGHTYPSVPLFGVAPCPTTIFTLGMLLLVAPRPPLVLLAIPVAWSAVGTGAALYLGVWEDFGLGAAALVAAGALAWQRSGDRRLAPQ